MNLSLGLTIIFIIVMGVGVFFIRKIKGLSEDGKFGYYLAFAAFIIVVLIVYSLSVQNKLQYEKELHENFIISLSNNNEVSGSFLIGSGQIKTEWFYYFYIETDRGVKKMKIPSDETYIKETDIRKPELTKTYNFYKDGDFWTLRRDIKPEFSTLYVPKGTIIKEFKIN